MEKKLLVIPVGTLAASVGLEIQKQMRTHPSDLEVTVRYIDTADLLKHYSDDIRPGERFQMSIDSHYIRAVLSNLSTDQDLENVLYPDLLPETGVSGGGGIRYNGAMAIEIERKRLGAWISASLWDLGGGSNCNISIVLIVSAIGATGSGSLERLIELITDCVYGLGLLHNTVSCDVFIMQPGSQPMTDLRLANTLALYAELAASELISLRSHHQRRALPGRKILVGWGDNILSSIEQLKETTATLVRFTTDPTFPFVVPFREAWTNNHVLHEIDPMSKLPMHLSTATAVTIGMSDLIEQIIERDAIRLLERLQFDTTPSTSPPNVLLGKFTKVLAGNNEKEMYDHLLVYLSGAIDMVGMNPFIDGILLSNSSSHRKVSSLSKAWQEWKDRIRQGCERRQRQDYVRGVISNITRELEQMPRERICQGGLSLFGLLGEYKSLQGLFNSIRQMALEDAKKVIDDSVIDEKFKILNSKLPLDWLRRNATLNQCRDYIKRNLQEHLRDGVRPFAIKILDGLEKYCKKKVDSLGKVLEKLRQESDNNDLNSVVNQEFVINSNHPLYLVALSTLEERASYAERVSIFSDSSDGWMDVHRIDPALELRKRLDDGEGIDALCKGNSEFLKEVAISYVKEKVNGKTRKYTIIDALLQAGQGALLEYLRKAMSKVTPLVSYSEQFASERQEASYVSADYRTDEQGRKILDTLKKIFPSGNWKLLKSTNPTEIAVFHYADGLALSAIDDLRGCCLNAFLKRRREYYKSASGLLPGESLDQRATIPLYSSKDAEKRVLETDVIHRIYRVKGREVSDYSQVDIPELRDNVWENMREKVRKALIQDRVVKSSSFAGSNIDTQLFFKQYKKEHAHIDLAYEERMEFLQLSSRTAPIVQQIWDLLEPIVHDAQNGRQGRDYEEFVARLKGFFQNFSSYSDLDIKYAELSRDFITFLTNTGKMFENIQIPNPLLTLVNPHHEVSDETIKNLHQLLVNSKNPTDTQIVLLILFCKTSDLDKAKRLFKRFRDTFSRDIVVVNHEDLIEVVSAKEPTQVIRRLILSQVSLSSLHPYVTDGPTSPHFFFGRERLLREISNHVAKKSYILIGGRRIGKTSILHRLFHIQLNERFQPLLFNCQSIDNQEPTKAEFLASCSRDWKVGVSGAMTKEITSFAEIVEVLSEDKPLVFLIDEADRLIPGDSSAGWPLFREMRVLAEAGRCQFVLAGEYGLSEAVNDSNSPFYNFGVKEPVTRLERPAVAELVTNPMKLLGIELVPPNVIVERIYEFTSGHPNIVQRLCQRLVDLLDERSLRKIVLEDIEDIVALRSFQQDDFLSTFWERATSLEKIISLVMSQGSKKYYTLSDIRKVLNDLYEINHQTDELEQALRRLTELRNILTFTSSQGYTFAAEAFPRVIANTTTAEDSLEVLVSDYLKSGDVVSGDDQIGEIVS